MISFKLAQEEGTSSYMSDLLPEDIQVEILLRLPVKSLLSFKCICKFWCSLICDPTFIKNHLSHSIQTNNHRLLVNYYNSAEQTYDYLERTSGFASISLTSSHSLPYDGYVSEDYPLQGVKELDWVKILGSSNGLICLLIISFPEDYNNDKYDICIWNPSTKEYKKVPLFRKSGDFYKAKYGFDNYDAVKDEYSLVRTDDIRKSDFYRAIYGFGYDGVNDDYKLVRIDDSEKSGYFNIQVYALGSDSWSNVQKMRYRFPVPSRCNGLLFNGALHWFGVVQETSIEVIVSLNLSNERIVEFPLPEAPLQHLEHKELYRNVGVNVGVLEDCLCLVLVDDFWKTIDAWVMKDYGVRESWTKQFTVIRDAHRGISRPFGHKLCSPICAFQNGDILANNTSNGYLIAENTKKSLLCNPREVGIRDVYISCVGNQQRVLESVSYVESLVSLNAGTYVRKWIPSTETHIKPEKEPENKSIIIRFLEFTEKLITMMFYS